MGSNPVSDCGGAILQESPVGVYCCDNSGKLTHANAALAALAGVAAPAELTGQPVHEVFGIALSALDAAARQAENGTTDAMIEHMLRNRRGEHVFVRNYPRLVMKNRMPRIEGIIIDDTMHKTQAQQQQALLDAILECFITIDSAGKIIAFNAGAERTFGYTAADVLGRPLDALIIPPRYRQKHLQGFDHLINNGNFARLIGKRLERTALCAGGKEIDVELMLHPFRSEGRSLFTACLRDISRQKQLESELRHRRKLEKIMASSIAQGVMATNAKDEIVYANPAFEKMTGYTHKELIGRPFLEIIVADDRKFFAQQDELRRQGQVTNCEARLAHKTGRKIPVLISATPRGSDGQIAGAVAVATDLSAQKKIERDLQKSETKARHAEEQLREAIESLSDAFALFDADDRLVLCNQKYAEIYDLPEKLTQPGTPFEFQLRATVSKGRIPAAAGREESWIQETLRLHRKREGTCIHQISDGRWIRVSEHGTKDGGVVGVRTNITALVEKEMAVRESEKRLRKMVDNLPAGAVYLEGDEFFCNKTTEHITGYTRSELTSFDEWCRRVHPENWAEMKKTYAFEKQRNFPSPRTASFVRKDGEHRWIEYVAYRFDHCEVWLVRDVTEQLRAQEEKQKLISLVEHSQDVIATAGFDGTLNYINQAGLRVLGLPDLRAARGRKITDFLTRDGKNKYREHVRTQLETQEIWNGRLLFRTAGSRKRTPLALHTFIIKDRSGAPLVIAAIGRDIAARLKAERALQESELKYRTLFNSIPDPVFLVDAENNHFLDCNQTALEKYGYSRTELKKLTPRALCDTDSRGETGDRNAVLAGDPAGQATTHVSKSGERFTVEVHEHRAVYNKRSVFVSIVRDVTERARAEAERRALEMQVLHAQKLESLGVLAGGIAHDFNNLLTSVLGNASLALMEISPTSMARESLEDIERAAQRAAELCKQLLAYSGKGKFVIQNLSISAVAEEMIHLLEISISKNTVLRFRLARHLPAIQADATQIRQVIMNLITNASDALEEKSGLITVSTGEEFCDEAYFQSTYLSDELPAGRYAYVEVADTGCGMAPEDVSKIFDPFYTTKFTGRGLGLAAVLGIVRGHGGAIKIQTEKHSGTVFKVLFPCAEQDIFPASTESQVAPPPRGAGTILVADDEASVRAISRRILEHAGYRVLTAADGREAVHQFASHLAAIDLILLDLTMPHLNGQEALQEMQKLDPGVRVVLMSGYDEQEAEHKFFNGKPGGFIQKPFKPQALVEIIMRVMQQ